MHINNRTGIKSVEHVLKSSMLASFPHCFLAYNKYIQWNKKWIGTRGLWRARLLCELAMQKEIHQKQTVPSLGIRQQGQAVCRGNISKTWGEQELGHETQSPPPQNQGLVSWRGICYGPVFEVYVAELWFHAMVSTAQLDEHWRVTDLATHFFVKYEQRSRASCESLVTE